MVTGSSPVGPTTLASLSLPGWEILIAEPPKGLAFHGLLPSGYLYIGLAGSVGEGMALADEALDDLGFKLCTN